MLRKVSIFFNSYAPALLLIVIYQLIDQCSPKIDSKNEELNPKYIIDSRKTKKFPTNCVEKILLFFLLLSIYIYIIILKYERPHFFPSMRILC